MAEPTPADLPDNTDCRYSVCPGSLHVLMSFGKHFVLSVTLQGRLDLEILQKTHHL